MKFQQEPIAMMTDIESMFFRYDEEHQNFVRLLWLENNKLKEELFDLEMCEHFFRGTSSRKFCNYALKCTLIDNKMNLKKKRLNKKIKKQVLVERALIIHWDIENKYFAFEIQLKYKSVTSRRMLPTISTVYDPLGIAASFVLEGLQILHRLCYLKSEGMKRYRII